MCEYMEKPCQHCPYRTDVKPFLTPERGEELAYITTNKYSSFPCHKTTEHDDDGNGYAVSTSKQCAGFLTLQAQNGEETYEDFKPSWEMVYIDPGEMAWAYESPANWIDGWGEQLKKAN